MRCIFCKLPSDESKSVEHIIPESLGNKEHILPPGWVCDGCNNYLSRKVESPFLDSWYGKNSRFEMSIPSKKGRIPPAMGLHPKSRSKVHVFREDDSGLSIAAAQGEDEAAFIECIRSQGRGVIYIPEASLPPQDYETARFIGKIALEVLAHRYLEIPGWNEEIVDKFELDELRNYVRFGRPNFIWPIHMRRIYATDFLFTEENTEAFEVLHEFDVLVTNYKDGVGGEFYAVIAIFGVEYAINLGGPELDGYLQWLKENNGRSYLYSKSS